MIFAFLKQSHFYKRIFLKMIMLLLCINKTTAQNFELLGPLADPVIINPAYTGLDNCKRLTINFKNNFYSDIGTGSFTSGIKNTTAGFALVVLNQMEGKSINTFELKGIFSKKITIKPLHILNLAFESSFIRQNINTSHLIYRHMINPIAGTVSLSGAGYNYPPVTLTDFAAGLIYYTPRYRTGFSIKHMSGFYNKIEQINNIPEAQFHFGYSFSMQTKYSKVKKIIIPELFVQYKDNNLRFRYGVSLYSNYLSAHIFAEHSTFQTVGYNVGWQYLFNKLSIGYTYNMTMNKYLFNPIHSHQVKIGYKYGCIEKRNKKNTIFCTSF